MIGSAFAYLFSRQVLHWENPETVCNDGQDFLIWYEPLDEPDHCLHATCVADHILALLAVKELSMSLLFLLVFLFLTVKFLSPKVRLHNHAEDRVEIGDGEERDSVHGAWDAVSRAR